MSQENEIEAGNPGQTTDVLPSGGASCSPRELAQKIAKRLFTDGSGNEATRLELKIKNPITISTHPEMALGAWCFNSAVDQIEKAIIDENV